MHTVRVGLVVKTLLEELGGAVRDHAITFHLSEPKAAVTGSALHWLSCEYLHWTSCARMDLVVDHMLQPLIVRRANEKLCLEPSPYEVRQRTIMTNTAFVWGITSVPVVHDFVSSPLIADAMKQLGYRFNSSAGERCGITFIASDSRYLAHQTLDQLDMDHRFSSQI